ncbi:hypothetical protein C0992_008141, partial [Termitomyces sp. T32_za158]
MAKLGKQPIPPGLQTRKANKESHPGVAAGVAPRSHASRAESQQIRERKLQEKIVHANLQAEARARVAAIEDQLHQEDMQRDEQVNHPPVHQSRVFKPPVASTPQNGGSRTRRKPVVEVTVEPPPGRPMPPVSTIDDNSSSEDYEPPSEGEDEPDENELEDDIDEELSEPAPPVKRGKKSKVRREDILALRMAVNGKRKAITSLVVPTPSKKSKKMGLSSGALIDAGWLSAHRHRGRQAVAAANDINQDNNSLVKMGGIVDDDEDDKVEREAMLKATIAFGRPSMVKITRTHNPNITQTELRGGDKKWTLKHLPPGTETKFTTDIIPLAKERLGTLMPWANLSSAELQNIIDLVYGTGAYTLGRIDAWQGL